MLGDEHKKVIVSTLREIRGLLPLVEEGRVEEVCGGSSGFEMVAYWALDSIWDSSCAECDFAVI